MHIIQSELRKKSNSKKAEINKRYFKTGPGEYGEGDEFIGVTIPKIREIAKKFIHTNNKDLLPLLKSKIHEDRMGALIILTYKYNLSKTEENKKEIVRFYLENLYAGNNWDLIDCVSDRILGPWLINKDKKILYNFAKSKIIWERRISIITTNYFIKNNNFQDTLNIAKILLKDKEDLIHKAVGWMLREVGKRNEKTLKKFLKNNYKNMPRTMLRYAIEKFPEKDRKNYLKGVI